MGSMDTKKKGKERGRASVPVRLEIFALGVITKEFELVGAVLTEHSFQLIF